MEVDAASEIARCVFAESETTIVFRGNACAKAKCQSLSLGLASSGNSTLPQPSFSSGSIGIRCPLTEAISPSIFTSSVDRSPLMLNETGIESSPAIDDSPVRSTVKSITNSELPVESTRSFRVTLSARFDSTG